MMGTLTGYYTIVQKILSRVTANTLREFAARKNDEDRFRFVTSLDYVRDAFNDVTPVSSEGKSSSESRRQREKGNSFYEKCEYMSALDCYTASILTAPVPLVQDGSSDEMVLALGNRSAALFQTERFEEALNDIALALQYGYPITLQYKIYDRQARCFLKTNEPKKALEAFETVTKVLKDSKLDESQQKNAHKNNEKQIEICKSRVEEMTLNTTKSVSRNKLFKPPSLAHGNNQRYPGASEAFEVKYSVDRGRYGVVSRDVNVGDVMIIEQPYASVLDSSQFQFRCYHCFSSLTAPVACYQCTRVRYCSETCRATSWEKYHNVECGYLGLLVSSGTGNISLLALRLMVTTGIVKVLKCRNNPKSTQPDAQRSLFTDSKGVYLGGFVGLYDLLTHSEHRAPNDLLQYAMLSVFIHTILQRTGYFDNCHDDYRKNQVIIGGVILRFLQIISCNGIEITEMIIGDNIQKSNPESIGLGLFPTVSLLNHSCDPAMELIFYDSKCCARTLRTIPSGGELSIDYGYLYYTTPKRQRLLAIRSQYYFDCNCLPCAKNWGLKATLKCDIPILKCSKCGQILPAEEHPDRCFCPRCNKEEQPMEVFESLHRSARQFEKALDDARKFQLHKAVPVLQTHLMLMDKHVCLPWKDYVTCTSMLKQCYRMVGNRTRRQSTKKYF